MRRDPKYTEAQLAAFRKLPEAERNAIIKQKMKQIQGQLEYQEMWKDTVIGKENMHKFKGKY